MANRAPNDRFKLRVQMFNQLHRQGGFADAADAQQGHKLTAFSAQPLTEGGKLLNAAIEVGNIDRFS